MKLFVALKINLLNIVKYGRSSPRFGERLWVDPRQIKYFITKEIKKEYLANPRYESGKVLDGDWDLKAPPMKMHQSCFNHFEKGISWESLGVYEGRMKIIRKKGSSVGCKNLEEVKERYANLDKLFAFAKKENRFMTSEELSGKKRIWAKGLGDIKLYIGRDGRFIKGPGGLHRTNIAKILKLHRIPVVVGLIHPEALDIYKELRKESKSYERKYNSL